MKTAAELSFEKHIIFAIAKRDCSWSERAELFCEFHKFSSKYYDEFCEALYLLSTGEAQGYLYMTPSGRTYISYMPRSTDDYRLLFGDELPPFQDDLYDQLIYCRQRFVQEDSCLPYKFETICSPQANCS